jgi:hypothetical protein
MHGAQVAMPIIVLNMGGEMIYILNQRLQAQNVPVDKARKVLGDVVRTMYTPMFLDELFKPQEIYTMASTKQIFDKLAHSSIMRLNKTSMDKLFDLMTMGVKYQLICSKCPQQFLQVTLNHLDTLMEMVRTEGVTDLIQVAINKSIDLYTKLSNGNWLLLEQALMQFFQGKKIKVSLFLQRHLQTMTGSLVLNTTGVLPYGTELPGEVRYYEGKDYIRSDEFLSDVRDQCTVTDQILEPNWTIGFNIYLKDGDTALATASDPHVATIGSPTSTKKGTPLIERAMEASASIQQASRAFARLQQSLDMLAPAKAPAPPRSPAKYSTHLSAKAELNLLSDLLGVTTGKRGEKKSEDRLFKINLFPNADFQAGAKGEDDGAKGQPSGAGYDGSGFITIDIDAAAGAKGLSAYMEDLDFDSDEDAAADAKPTAGSSKNRGQTYQGEGELDEDDLLALMDSAK